MSVGEDVGVFGRHELRIGGELASPKSNPVVPLLLKPRFVQPRGRKRLDTAHVHEIEQGTSREAPAINPENVGVEGDLLQANKLL